MSKRQISDPKTSLQSLKAGSSGSPARLRKKAAADRPQIEESAPRGRVTRKPSDSRKGITVFLINNRAGRAGAGPPGSCPCVKRGPFTPCPPRGRKGGSCGSAVVQSGGESPGHRPQPQSALLSVDVNSAGNSEACRDRTLMSVLSAVSGVRAALGPGRGRCRLAMAGCASRASCRSRM